MGLMIDSELRDLVGATVPQIMDGVEKANLTTQVHGTAVEMRIGDIFRPGSEPQKPGSADCPRERYVLSEGETAVIRTIESFKLDSQHTALVLPVSSVSLQGLLMTNPGQVDPGYEGPVHVTVINMGHQPYMLRKGDRLLRALVFKLDKAVASPYCAQKPATDVSGSVASVPQVRQLLRKLITKLDELLARPSRARAPISQELLDTLSPDFLSVSARGSQAAKREIDAAIRANTIWQFAFPAIVAALSALGGAWITNHSLSNDFDHRIKTMEDQKADTRLHTLEDDFPTEKRLNSIEESLRQLRQEQARAR
jgi:deoxycytidine triphosphate deaminase